MIKIPLTQGKEAIIDDDDDFELVNKYKWCYGGPGYAMAYKGKDDNGVQKFIWMHRLINNTPIGFDTDHINLNKLDNRKSNLRNATKSQNKANTKKHLDGKNPYKGVYRDKSIKEGGKVWHAKITFKGKTYRLGFFYTPEEAKEEYNDKAKVLYGEFAR